MVLEIAAQQDLGLRHVLENGLAVIRNEPVSDAQRAQIFENLIKIFSEADKGAGALRSQNLLFAVSEPPAFERFSVFFRYLKDQIGADVPDRLSEARVVLEGLSVNQPQAHDKRERLEKLMEMLLDGLHSERASAPLIAPMEMRFA